MSVSQAHDGAETALRRLTANPPQMVIGGGPAQAVDGRTFETFDPATGEALAMVPLAGAADVDRAVAAARDALSGEWSRLLPAERARAIMRLAEAIEANLDELAVLETLDNGKPLAFAKEDVAFAAEVFRHFSGAPTRLAGTLPPSGPDRHAYVRREPVGVCGMIVAWNFPLLLVSWKLAPALACANTAVIKPAEQTPLSALRFAELCLEAGLPAGVVNVVTGAAETGKALVDHPDVDKIGFTGSTEVGKEVMAGCAKTMKRVTLELGGKSPNVVFADADFDTAVETAMLGIFANSGQVCSAGSRLLVERSLHDRFVSALVERTATQKIGSGLEEETTIGPVVSVEQLERVSGYIEIGRGEGADLCYGGELLERPGFFVEPTIFGSVSDSMQIAQEEIFGPVLAVTPFDDLEDAIAKANGSRFGLAAGIWTRDLSRAHRFAAAVQAGTVWVNGYNSFDAAIPFGGFKESGLGRELGDEALDAYSELKAVMVNL